MVPKKLDLWAGKSRHYNDGIIFKKAPFLNSSSLKSVLQNRFRSGLVWTVGLIVEIQLRIQTSQVWY